MQPRALPGWARALQSRAPVAVALLGLACSQAQENGEAVFVDSVGRGLRWKSPPSRIVSLAPNLTEILYRLGVEERIVGVTSYCDHPEAATRKPTVGDFSTPRLERLLGARPDLIVMTWNEQAYLLPRLEALGFKVAVLYPTSVRELTSVLRSLAQLFGKKPEVQGLLDSLHVVANGIRVDHRPRVFVEICYSPLMTADDSSFVGRVVELAGGNNVAENLPRDYCAVSPEMVVQTDPEVILLLGEDCTEQEVLDRLGWSAVAAVRTGAVCAYPTPDVLVRAGPRIVRGWADLVRLLHPEVSNPFGVLRTGEHDG
jgi:iron complex transport system substrate-binding protein